MPSALSGESLRLDRDEIRLTINAYTNNGLSIEEIERFWLGEPRWLD